MKRIALLLMAALTFGFSSCSDDEKTTVQQPEPDAIDMVNTTWVGYYNDYMVHPQAGQVPVHLKWTVDFNENNVAEVFLEADADGQQQAPQSFSFNYSIDGLNGTFYYDDGQQTAEDHFVINPYNRSFDWELVVPMGFSAEDPQQVGGVTTFHQQF